MMGLNEIAVQLTSNSKGILAADESGKTIEKRFAAVSLASTEENRRDYRELLFTTPHIQNYISGVILFDETIHQKTKSGIAFPDYLSELGIIPGIKVDKGTIEMPQSPGEKITDGLDDLAERLREYKSLGAKFAKWRAVFTVGEATPSEACLGENAMRLGKYAKICQDLGILPIVEPEVLMDGAHTMDRCRGVTYKVLKTVFSKLSSCNVDFSGMLLKPNMVLPGKESEENVSPHDVAELTTKVFQEILPDELPGVVFLSGGQSPQEATVNLNEINKFKNMKWAMSFSFGRALQEPVLKAWAGKKENTEIAQREFLKRAKLASLAASGLYGPALENEV